MRVAGAAGGWSWLRSLCAGGTRGHPEHGWAFSNPPWLSAPPTARGVVLNVVAAGVVGVQFMHQVRRLRTGGHV